MIKLFNTNKQWIGIKATSKKDGEFIIPVVDVRNSDYQRKRAERIIKESNDTIGSKFFKKSYSLIGKRY